MSEARLLAEVRRAGGRVEAVRLTRNRRVMLSVAEGGRVLRLHEAFANAPPEVLRAVGALVAGAPRQRAAARRILREFVRQIPSAPAASPAPRQRRISGADQPHLASLRAEFDRVNALHFGGRLPAVPIYLSGRMRRRNGHFSAHPLEIVISRRLCEEAADGEACETLRHEMIHLWQHLQHTRPGHGRDFRDWARRLDVHPRAARVVEWCPPGRPMSSGAK